MKATFNKSGNKVSPKVAELFVKIGIAKWDSEPEVVIPERKLKVIEQPFVPSNKPKGKPKGRPAKVKK